MYLKIREAIILFILSMSFVLAGIFLLKWKRFNKQEKVFGYFLLLNVLFETIAWVTADIIKIKNNLPGLHLYTLLEFLLIVKFTESNITKLKGLPSSVLMIAGSILIFLNTVFIQNIYTYNSISIAGVKIFTIVVSVIFFYKILSTKRYDILEIKPSVYFFTAIFLNASVSLIWYMYSNSIILLNKEMNIKLSLLKNSAGAVASIIIFIGIILAITRNTDKQKSLN